MVKLTNKSLAASGYLFCIPALYITLSKYRKDGYLGRHGAKALILWAKYFLVFFSTRLLISWIWNIKYIAWLDYFTITAVLGMAVYLILTVRKVLAE